MPTRSADKCAQLLHITFWTFLWRPMNVHSVAARLWQLHTQSATQSTRTIMTTDAARTAVARHQSPRNRKICSAHFATGGSSSWGEFQWLATSHVALGQTRSISKEDPIWKLNKTEEQQQGHSSGNNRGQLVLQDEVGSTISRTLESNVVQSLLVLLTEITALHDHELRSMIGTVFQTFLGPVSSLVFQDAIEAGSEYRAKVTEFKTKGETPESVKKLAETAPPPL